MGSNPTLASSAPPAPPELSGNPPRFVRWFLGTAAMLLFLIGGANWLADPWGIYPPQLLPLQVTDGRRLKARLLAARTPPPEQLVLGSSRMIPYLPATLERESGLRTFNAAVPGAAPIDLFVLYRYATEEVHAPIKSVLIGVEPSMFREEKRNYLQVHDDPQLAQFLPPGPLPWGDPSDVFSGRMLADTWRGVRTAIRTGRRRGRAASRRARSRIGPDGGVRPDRPDAPSRFERQDFTGRLQPVIPPRNYRDLERLLALLRSRGVRTRLIVTPVLAPEELRSDPKWNAYQAQFARRMAELAAAHGAEVADFTRLESFGGSAVTSGIPCIPLPPARTR